MYSTVFVFLILGGLGFPVPEEIPLVLGGMALAKDLVSIEGIFFVCYLGVLIGDQTMYAFGYFFGQKILDAGTKSTFLPFVTPEKVAEVRDGLRRKRLLYLFIGRHLFFLRSVTFVICGALHIPFKEYLLADAAAALLSVCIFMGLGYLLGDQLSPEVITHIARKANLYLGLMLVIGLVFYLAVLRPRAKKRESEIPAVSAQKQS